VFEELVNYSLNEKQNGGVKAKDIEKLDRMTSEKNMKL
jgi:hypothetical protein